MTLPILSCSSVRKVFRSFERSPGWTGLWTSFFRRRYVDAVVLDDLDLRVERGELVGLIGPNGAGKTTLVKCLTGIIPVTGGSAQVFGCDSFELGDENKRRLSLVMGQRSQLWWDLPAIDSFELLSEIYQVPVERFRQKVKAYAERLEVADKLGLQLRQLSLGERMKMEIIGAFLHDPEVVFLDEPTIGLDLVSRDVIRAFLREINDQEGATILLTSHDLEDIENTCRRLLVLDKGRLLFDGDRIELQHQIVDERSVELHLAAEHDGFSEELAREIESFGARLVARTQRSLTFKVPSRSTQALVRRLFEVLEIRDLSIERQPLEQLIKDLFLRIKDRR